MISSLLLKYFEVMIKGPHRQAGFPADVLNRHSVKAAHAGQGQGCVQQLLSAGNGLLLPACQFLQWDTLLTVRYLRTE